MKTKDRILEVAGAEFAKVGFDGLSMNALVEKLDINKATVYYHFKDKKALYYEVIRIAMQRSNDNIRAVFMGNKDPETLFRSYINAHILTIKQNPNVVPLALREIANFGADVDESFLPFVEEEINYLKIVIEKLDLKDEYKDMKIFTLYSFILGSIKTFYAIQMSELPIGTGDDLKQDSEKTLNYISEFISNLILDAIVKK